MMASGPFNLVYEVRPQARPQVVPGTALCRGPRFLGRHDE